MALERIPPLARTAPATRPPANAPGEQQMQLVVAKSPTGELLGRSADGRDFKLGAALGANAPLVPGQVLMVQIIRTTPTLELMVLGGAQGQAQGPDGFGDLAGREPRRFGQQPFAPDTELAALQTDQAAMRRLTRSSIEPAVLAASWRALVLSHLQRSGTVAGPYFFDEPQPVIRQLPLSSLASAASEESTARIARLADAVLVLRVQAWSDLPLTVWLVPRGSAYQGTNRRSARRNDLRLRLTLQHPSWGPISIEVDVLDTNVALTLSAARATAVTPLRDSVSAIVQRLLSCGLRLARCHVEQSKVENAVAAQAGAPAATPVAAQMSHMHGADALTAQLPLALFRAATEVLAALQFSPPSR